MDPRNFTIVRAMGRELSLPGIDIAADLGETADVAQYHAREWGFVRKIGIASLNPIVGQRRFTKNRMQSGVDPKHVGNPNQLIGRQLYQLAVLLPSSDRSSTRCQEGALICAGELPFVCDAKKGRRE